MDTSPVFIGVSFIGVGDGKPELTNALLHPPYKLGMLRAVMSLG